MKSNFKLDFIYDKNSLKFDNLYFRDKNLSFNSEGNIIFEPFFKVNLNSEIENINTYLLKDLDIINILSSKDLIKKLNGQVNINFKSKKFKKNLIDNLKIDTELVFGRLNFSKNLSIFKSEISCSSEINLLDEFPVILFDCFVDSLNKKILFKKMNIDKKIGNEIINLKVEGNLNILNNKINFNYIEIDKSKFNKEDLKYFKINFEKILFDENFLKIFSLKKIKKFIEEVN